jgi:diguanylate cyclase (GGDEF)-like protein
MCEWAQDFLPADPDVHQMTRSSDSNLQIASHATAVHGCIQLLVPVAGRVVTALVNESAWYTRFGTGFDDAGLAHQLQQHQAVLHAAVARRVAAGAREPVVLRATDFDPPFLPPASPNPPPRLHDAGLPDNEQRFRHLLEKLPAGAYTCDSAGLITWFNPPAQQLWGRAPKLNDPLDRYCGSFKLHALDGSAIAHDQCWMALALKSNREYNGHEIVIERPNGQRVNALAHANPIHDASGALVGAVNVLVDISERKRVQEQLRRAREEIDQRVEQRTRVLRQANRILLAEVAERKLAEERIRHLAQHDHLTGLPNRLLLADRVEQAMLHARRERHALALLYLDLDHFKPINDRLGHRIGDLLLIALARRLTDCLRDDDTVARVGGDEFVVLLHSLDGPEDGALVARKILDAVALPFMIEGQALELGCSIGLAVFPGDAGDFEDLLRSADRAMYRAKQGGNQFASASGAQAHPSETVAVGSHGPVD